MPGELQVVSLCAYYTRSREARPADQATWAAMKFVKALKGEPFSGDARVPVPLPAGDDRTLNADSAGLAPKWFGESIATFLLGQDPSWPVILVPVPSSKATSREQVEASRLFQAIKHAASLPLTKGKLVPGPMLWFGSAQPSSHKQGGTRDPAAIANELKTGESPASGASCVLIDDVVTSGGHLLAADATLRERGHEVWFAICGAKTSQVELVPSFKARLDAYQRLPAITR